MGRRTSLSTGQTKRLSPWANRPEPHDSCFFLLQNELMKEARTIVEERRSAVVMGIRGESGRDGVFQWVSGPPTAGKPATLAYNKNSGGLRNSQVPHGDHRVPTNCTQLAWC